MRFPRYLAIDCGSSRMTAVLLAQAGSVTTLQDFAQVSLPEGLADDDEWLAATRDAFLTMARQIKYAGPMGLIVPGHLSLTKFLKIPHVEESKRRKIVEFEARQNIPYPLNEVVWDYQVVADDGVEFEVAINAVKTGYVETICAYSRAAGWDPLMIEPVCMTQINAFHFNYPEITESSLIINIGSRSTDLIFVSGGRFFLRNLALGGNSLTANLASDLGVEFPRAERIKRASPETSTPREKEAMAKARQSFASRLVLEINRSMALYRRQCNAEPPQHIFSGGGGSELAGLPEAISERLKQRVERYDALRHLEIGPGLDRSRLESGSYALGEALGAALGTSRSSDAQFNLLPPKIVAIRQFRKRQPLLLGAACFVVGAMALPVLSNLAAIASYEEKLANLEAQVQPVRQLDRRIRQNLRAIDQVRDEIEVLSGVMRSRANWILFLSDLQERLVSVEHVWLDELRVNRTAPAEAAPASGLFGRQVPAMDLPSEPSLELTLSGRLLDLRNPVSSVSEESFQRVRSLLRSFVESEFITEVKNERFDNSEPGLLRFDFVLVVNPEKPL